MIKMALEKIISLARGMVFGSLLAACSSVPKIPSFPAHQPRHQQDLTAILDKLDRDMPTITAYGDLATGLSNLRRLREDEIRPYQKLYFTLPEGTQHRGLYLRGQADKPLLIGTFGFLSDIQAHAVYNFLNIINNSPLRDYNILILDHPSSAPFYCANGEASWGGIEEGYFIVEIAQQMKQRYGHQSVHALGISMGGNGVIHAAYRGKGVLDSVLAISAVTDYMDVPGSSFRQLNEQSAFGKSFGLGLIHNIGFKELIAGFNGGIEKNPACRRRNIQPSFDGQTLERLFLETKRYHHHSRLQLMLEPYVQQGIISSHPFRRLEEYLIAADAIRVAPFIQVPLYLLHSADDGVVEDHHFYREMLAGRGNEHVAGHLLRNGSHWGAAAAYGEMYIGCLITTAVNFQTPSIPFSPDKRCF